MAPSDELPDIDPIGAVIAVAFTGAVVAFGGFALSFVSEIPGLVVADAGLLAILFSPLAWFRFRTLQSS